MSVRRDDEDYEYERRRSLIDEDRDRAREEQDRAQEELDQ